MKTTTQLLLLVFLFTLLGCSKYEEGNASIISAKIRICRTWEPIKYHYSDGSSTSNVDKGFVTLRKDMTGTIQIGQGALSISINGHWKFFDNNTKINFKANGIDDDYEIVKLSLNTLKLRDKLNTVIEYEATN
ncbi:MAG TPA: hypothetical protein VL021_11355 [Brumimicrobium sp.]|nr:hypothetical protein [Brumimicrobium sp.]